MEKKGFRLIYLQELRCSLFSKVIIHASDP